MKRRFAVLLAATLLGSATSLPAKPVTATLPPFESNYQPNDIDEKGLWMLADEDERGLRDSKLVIHDVALNTYLHGVLCRTVGTDRCGSVRIYVERVPAFNASMAPNGTLRIWTGLLLRIRSEAELAAVLGHEFGHFEERHSLAGYRQARSATDVMAFAGLLGLPGLMVQLSAMNSFFVFNRAQEKEADVRAFGYVAASPYRPGVAADIWGRLMDEADATAAGRNQRSHRYDQVSFFASHPPELERATYLRDMAKKDGDDGIDGADAYRTAMAPWMAGFLADQIKLNNLTGTEFLLGQLAAANGWTPDLLVARGELYRLRGNPRDLVTAAGYYRQAIADGTSDPDARRGLGLTLMRSQLIDEGRQALREYLTLKPAATDAAMITMLIGGNK